MFAIQCTTCGAKLAVKNDDLVGQILACPKCGGMVLIERPEKNAAPPFPAEKPASGRKVFPDFLTSGTESGVINVEPKSSSAKAQPENSQSVAEFSTESSPGPSGPPPPLPVFLSESELRTRKILLGVLIGLLLLLVGALGVLATLKGDRYRQNDGEEPQQRTDPTPVERPNDVAAPEIPKPVPDDSAVEEIPVKEISQEPTISATGETAEKSEQKEKEPEIGEMEESGTGKPEAPSQLETSGEPEGTGDPIRSTTDLLSKLESKLPGLIEPSATLSVDIPARLGQPIAGLTLNETPLIVALRTLSTLTEVPMTLDVDEFRCRGIRIDAPLTQRFEGGTIGVLLTQLLDSFGLEPVIEDRQILITVSPERRDRIMERTFDVADLVEKAGNDDASLTPSRLLELLRRLVDPVGFGLENPSDDQPSIRMEGDRLLVRHRLRSLDASLRTLEQLRVIRGLPQTTDVNGEQLVPEAFGWDAVDAPLTLNHYQSTPLAGVLQRLEAATGLRILVDHQALHRALAPLPTITATVRCDRGTINEALERLLDSVNVARLTYRIVDAGTLEVTTRDVARRPDKMSIEVHRYETPESPFPKDETVEQLVRTIRSVLEPESWYEPGQAETVGQGDIVVDRPSGCLIVRQSQPVQRQLRLWLGRRLDAKRDEQTPAPEISPEIPPESEEKSEDDSEGS